MADTLMWKTIKTSYGDLVEVSSNGDVRDPVTKNPMHIYYPSPRTYPFISIKSNRTQSGHYPQMIHKLVAQAFVYNDDPSTKTNVNHIDGDKTNNNYKNLEWVTPSENIQHAYRTGLKKGQKDEDHPMSKYSNDQIRQVCDLITKHPDWSFDKIGRSAGVDKWTVYGIHQHKVHTEISKDYKFPRRLVKVTPSDSQVEAVCRLIDDVHSSKRVLSQPQIAEMTGVKVTYVSDIATGRTRTDISAKHKFYQDKFGTKG